MFKFNFGNESAPSQPIFSTEENHRWYKSKEIFIPTDISLLVSRIPRNQIIQLDFNFGRKFCCLSAREAMNMLKDKSGEEFFDVLKADKQHSDLVPGKYEGGLKTWECTRDLAAYFMNHMVKNENSVEFGKKAVLDLGCGTGLLGIMCLLLRAYVTFQDYNQEVLEAITIPNIFLNCHNSVKDKIKLYSGDWSSFLELMLEKIREGDSKNAEFDYILTSETIYNPKNYLKIISIIKKLLKSNGVTFVAAKSHYFGVGGNLNEFETLLKENGLCSSMVWESKKGVSRGILEVKIK